MDLAQQWLEIGPPIYRQRYLSNTGDGWRLQKNRLRVEQIQEALQGQAEYGYYGSSISDCVALDLDDHKTKAWTGETPSVRLETLYNNVRGALSTPSMVFRSPRGLHAYYKLESMYPASVLTELTFRRTHKYGAEVRPTMQQGLRFPRLVDRLDPHTLSPIPEKGLQEVPVKYAGELFGLDHTVLEIREQLKHQSGQAKYVAIQAHRVAKAERRIVQAGLTGVSNEALCTLAPIYAHAGFTLDGAVYRFLLLTQEAGYTGELTNEHRLKNRMESLYYGYTENGYAEEHRKHVTVEPGLFDSAIIEHLMQGSPFARQREKPLRRFLVGLFDWINYQDAILEDPASMALWNYLYPYHRHNVRRGYFPFPSSMLKGLNGQYETIIRYLLDTGFLGPAPFKYQVGGRNRDKTGLQAGVCKHYTVNRELGVFG